jgi:hypothetical protein
MDWRETYLLALLHHRERLDAARRAHLQYQVELHEWAAALLEAELSQAWSDVPRRWARREVPLRSRQVTTV